MPTNRIRFRIRISNAQRYQYLLTTLAALKCELLSCSHHIRECYQMPYFLIKLLLIRSSLCYGSERVLRNVEPPSVNA